jgi:hypothetical protein
MLDLMKLVAEVNATTYGDAFAVIGKLGVGGHIFRGEYKQFVDKPYIELIGYKQRLTDAQVEEVAQYFAKKFGISPRIINVVGELHVDLGD